MRGYKIPSENLKMNRQRPKMIKMQINDHQHEMSFKTILVVYRAFSIDMQLWWMMEHYQVPMIYKDYYKKETMIQFYQH